MTLLAVTMPGVPEMIIIALIFVLLFGAKKLPELGGAIGKSIKSFKQGVEDGQESGDDQPDAEATDSPTQISSDGK
jgi:sec-independent protein translocase protein TatA